MKKKFSQFYEPTEEEFQEMWEKALFVFDANVLLNLYRYSVETRKKILSIMEELNDRIWIPYNVAYEYQHNRISAINEQLKIYKSVIKSIDEVYDSFNNKINYKRHPYIDLENLKKRIKNFFGDLKNEIKTQKNKYPNFFQKDEIRNKLDELFENRVGEKFSKDKLKKIYNKGQERYEREYPPGYEDKNDKDIKESYNLNDNREYGDLIIWKQIIKKAKNISTPIIFITDDSKDDWWWRQAGKTQGPRPELVNEIKEQANVNFYMYDSMGFLKFAKDFLSSDIEDKIIDEVKNVNKNIYQLNKETISMSENKEAINNLIINNEHLVNYLEKILNSSSENINTIELLKEKREKIDSKLKNLYNLKNNNDDLDIEEYNEYQNKIRVYENELKNINKILSRWKIANDLLSDNPKY